MKNTERLQHFAAAIDATAQLIQDGLDLDNLTSFYIANYERSIELRTYESPYHSDAERAVIRHCKRVFGPLIAEGNPPNVVLVGVLDICGVTVKYRHSGAFKCEITGQKELDLTAEELKERADALLNAKLAASQTTKIVHTYSCEPVRPPNHPEGATDE